MYTAGATCRDVHCGHGQRCLSEWRGDSPRCVSCSSMSCPDPVRHRTPEVCGTNNRTYSSWCHMLQDACDTGYVIETQAPAYCVSGLYTGGLQSTSPHVLQCAAALAKIVFILDFIISEDTKQKNKYITLQM